MYRLPASVALVVALAGCVPASRAPAPVVRAAPPPVAPPPPRSSDWRDWPVTPGAWRYAAAADGSYAAFGAGVPGGEAPLTLRCDRAARRITIATPPAAAAPLTIRTTSMTRTLAIPMLAAGDALLDAMAFSRGRLVVERSGAPALVVPAQAEIGRVIEDCRG